VSDISSCLDSFTLTRQLVDIESISGNESAVGNYLYGELCRIGYQRSKSPWKATVLMSTPHRPSSPILSWFFHAHGYVPPFTPSTEDAARSTAAAPATRKESSPPSRRSNAYAGRI